MAKAMTEIKNPIMHTVMLTKAAAPQIMNATIASGSPPH